MTDDDRVAVNAAMREALRRAVALVSSRPVWSRRRMPAITNSLGEQAVPTVEILSKEEIESRRSALLASVKMTEAELRDRADIYALTPREAGILTEIDGLGFLIA